jgi:pseudouridine-5'-phosphate glycosidase
VHQEVPGDEIEKHIQQALAAAAAQGITGKDLTPFLLAYIARHTQGESLQTNIALIKNNAVAGAKIAVAFAAL